MKGLSLTQPWASLVAVGAKRIETRSWATKHRGTVAIHAAKTFPASARANCSLQPFLRELTRAGLSRPELPLGAIVATAQIALVFHTGDSLNYQHISRTMRGPNGLTYEMTPQEYAFGDYSAQRYGWVLTDVRRLPIPIPCKGALGLWEVPAAIYEAIALQMLLTVPA
jgi:activating signal cointegrator 1